MPGVTTGRISIADWVLAIIALGIATFLIFQNLSAPAIRQWDEAIYADNALDMYMTGDPIVMRRNGEVTFYNTKPPLVIWLQTLSMHVFGVNEFAIRFPSALVGVLTCVILLLFSIKALNDIRIGTIAVLVLATTYGFVKQHVVKTGDLDAVLVMWVTLYSLLFFHFLLTTPTQYRLICSCIGIGVAAAFLTKGIAGWIPMVGLFVSAILMRRVKWILSQRHTYLVAGLVLLLCIGYYVLREYLTPGYLTRTVKVDYGRFLTQTMAWHHHPWYYYFWNWYRLEFFTPYVFWLPVAIVIGLLSKVFHRPVMLLTTHVLVFIGILSYPIVKLMWYDAPVYPFLALLCAIGGVVVWDFIKEKIKLNKGSEAILFTILLASIFFIPVRDMYRRNADQRLPVDILEREGFFIRELSRNNPVLKRYKVLMVYEQNAHYTQVDFYMNAYNRYMGFEIELLRDTTLVQLEDTIACCQEKQLQWLKAHFECEVIVRGETGCEIMKLGQSSVD